MSRQKCIEMFHTVLCLFLWYFVGCTHEDSILFVDSVSSSPGFSCVSREDRETYGRGSFSWVHFHVFPWSWEESISFPSAKSCPSCGTHAFLPLKQSVSCSLCNPRCSIPSGSYSKCWCRLDAVERLEMKRWISSCSCLFLNRVLLMSQVLMSVPIRFNQLFSVWLK